MDTLERELELFFEDAQRWKWKWASSFEGGAEHSYVVKGKQAEPEAYERAFRVLQAFGVPRKFYKRTNIELHCPDLEIMYGKPGQETLIKGVKFWPMTERMSVSGVFNMAPIESEYGEQDAPSTLSLLPRTHFDRIAATYVDALEESRDLETWRSFIWREVVGDNYVEDLLDIGAGTGTAIEAHLVRKKTEAYRAVDPSQGMLNVLAYRQGWAKDLHAQTAAEYLETPAGARRFHTVVALGGSASYLVPETIRELADRATKTAVFMFYAQEHLTSFYGETNIPDSARESRLAAAALYGATTSRLGDYEITVVRK